MNDAKYAAAIMLVTSLTFAILAVMSFISATLYGLNPVIPITFLALTVSFYAGGMVFYYLAYKAPKAQVA